MWKYYKYLRAKEKIVTDYAGASSGLGPGYDLIVHDNIILLCYSIRRMCNVQLRIIGFTETAPGASATSYKV